MVSFVSFDCLPTHLSSSTCICIQITHETASSSTSSELPADRNVVGSSGGDAPDEASHAFFANDDFNFSF